MIYTGNDTVYVPGIFCIMSLCDVRIWVVLKLLYHILYPVPGTLPGPVPTQY